MTIVVNPFDSAEQQSEKAGAEAVHAKMLPVWINQMNPDKPIDVSRLPLSYLRELYPNVFYWGPMADKMVYGLQVILEKMNETYKMLNVGKATSLFPEDIPLPEGSLFHDLLTTYEKTYLARIFIDEEMKPILSYTLHLHKNNLFQVAYRNVDPSEVTPENLIARTTETILHKYYKHSLAQHYPKEWEGINLQYEVRTVMSMFIRFTLSEPVLTQLEEFSTDWDRHIEFCNRWNLLP